MIRKLLLSVMGAFWSSQSTICIATALLVSSIFLVLHFFFQPYKSTALNRMQSLSLTALTLFYYCGLLLKTESIEASDQEDLGVLMVVLLALIFVSAICIVASEVRAVAQWVTPIWHAFSILYEGNILEKAGVPCISSFPGKFEAAWNEVTRLGRSTKADVSVACVFLPMRTPDFGQHVDNPETAGKCYCHSLYGGKHEASSFVLITCPHILSSSFALSSFALSSFALSSFVLLFRSLFFCPPLYLFCPLLLLSLSTATEQKMWGCKVKIGVHCPPSRALLYSEHNVSYFVCCASVV
jgi:hypothetical protein